MSFNAGLKKAQQSTIVALTGKTAGSTTGAATFNLSGALDPQGGSISANVSCGLTTSTTTVTTKWQVSNDGTTWLDYLAHNGAANVTVPAAGTGSLVTTAYAQSLPANVPYPYVRLACAVGVATAGVGDNVTISYNWKKNQA